MLCYNKRGNAIFCTPVVHVHEVLNLNIISIQSPAYTDNSDVVEA